MGKVDYNSASQEYCIDDIDDILDNIGEVEIVKRSKYPSKIKKIKYNNKIYEVTNKENKKVRFYMKKCL